MTDGYNPDIAPTGIEGGVDTNALPWLDIPQAPGLRFKPLRASGETGMISAMVGLAAGTELAPAVHLGAADLLVLAGRMHYTQEPLAATVGPNTLAECMAPRPFDADSGAAPLAIAEDRAARLLLQRRRRPPPVAPPGVSATRISSTPPMSTGRSSSTAAPAPRLAPWCRGCSTRSPPRRAGIRWSPPCSRVTPRCWPGRPWEARPQPRPVEPL